MSKMLNIFANLLVEQSVISLKNGEKVQECIDKYWDAVILPRKLKKKVRKQANEDYNFWCSIRDYHNAMFLR